MSRIPFSYLRRVADVQRVMGRLGNFSIEMLLQSGEISILFWRTVGQSFATKLRWRATLEQAHKIGVASLPLVMLTSLFTGVVLALQSAYQLQLFSAEQFTSDLVALSVTRELGPVLTAMMVAGRVGAAMAAELGTMKVSEEVDALTTMGIPTVPFLVVPRLFAIVIMVPTLTVVSYAVGMLGGYLIGVFSLGINSAMYIQANFDALVPKDMLTGLVKSGVFALLVGFIATYCGLSVKGGAEGVGKATTQSVVASIISIIVADGICTAIFYYVLP